MTNEQYIEHEVQIRVQKETTDKRFLMLEKELFRIENKINWVLGVLVTSIIIPSLLKLTHFL